MKQGVPRTTGNSLFFLHCKIADCNSEEGRKLRFTSLNLHTTSQTDTYYGEAMAAIRAGEAGVISCYGFRLSG